MFQRLRGELKGAFDTIADEQNRLRAQQATLTPARRSTDQSRPQSARTTRPKLPASELSGPDADPSQFIVGDETSTRSTPETSKINGPILEEASTQDVPASEAAPAAAPSISQAQTNGDGKTSAGELSADVQSKLRKLNKLESKYSELLKAYRRAHARNSLIEPFEARLRETTPLTSISDPEGLVDFISQLSAKGDMVMGELKKVSGEKDSLKLRLDEAEEKTKAAYDEVARFQELSKKGSEPTEAPSPVTENDVMATTIAPPISSSPKILSLGKNLFSPRQKPMQLPEETNGDMFSVEDEVPKLQSELQERDQQIEQLQSETHLLKGELATARESAEHMMTDLEKAQKELERVRADYSGSDEDKENQITQLKHTIVALEGDLKKAEEDLKSARSDIGAHEQEVNDLHEKETQLEKELADLRVANTHEPELPVDVTHTLEPSTETSEAANIDAAAAKKKKNKKKKKKGTATTAEAEEPSTINGDATGNIEPTASTSHLNSSLSATAQLREKDDAIDRLHGKLRSQDDLLEEIEGLKDDLLTLGQEHVETKEKIKEIETERQRLQKRCEELEAQLDSSGTQQTQNEILRAEAKEAAQRLVSLEQEKGQLKSRVNTLETEMVGIKNQAETSSASIQAREELSKNFEDLRIRSKTLESDLTAAQQLATTRYKEMTSLRDLLSKAQPELTSLRTQVSELKSSRDELTSRNKDFRKLELLEESLRNEIDTMRKDTASRDSDMTSLRQKVTQETDLRIAAEETNRRAQRDLQRAQAEALSAITDRDVASSQLIGSNQQLEESRTRLKQLERQVEQLTSQSDSLHDEISLKTAQHVSAESLMRSVRDQASEMATQMKEAQGRCESLEEELNDAHRLMSERGRESETMRRLLSEVEQRAESRVKEMRERMEMAVQERDRAEDEANSVGRRRTREVEEIKGKLRDAEREARRVKDDKEDLERIERDLRRQKDDDLKRIEGTTRELEDVRRAMAELRDALDDGEKQTRDFEVERNELKRSLDEAQQRVEKLQKSNKTLTDDLRSLRSTRMRPTDSPVQSSRSSHESAHRVASPVGSTSQVHTPMLPSNTSLRGSVSSQSTNSIDFVYLKNVLLQFLEQKDKQHQMQLVPVLSMLLRFDKRDEQKWTAAIAAK